MIEKKKIMDVREERKKVKYKEEEEIKRITERNVNMMTRDSFATFWTENVVKEAFVSDR
jgi:hypothetical protein